jgi:Rieske Fe-S protein
MGFMNSIMRGMCAKSTIRTFWKEPNLQDLSGNSERPELGCWNVQQTESGETAVTERSTSASATRRAIFGGVGAVGAAALLAACGDGDDAATADSGQRGPVTLGKTSDVPVGGGTIYADQGVVVTQPTAGDFKGFSAICTHQSCPVANVSNGLINCTCHNSAFSIADGSVKAGPAPRALEAKRLKLNGDSITLA